MSVRVDLIEGARIALVSLRVNRLRTLLTTAGIGVGVATLLAILGIIQGLNASFASQLAAIGGSSLQVAKYPWMMADDWWRYRNRHDLTPEQADIVRRQSTYAVAVAPSVERTADVAALGKQVSTVEVIGTTVEDQIVGAYEMTHGRFLSEEDDANAGQVAVLGADVTDGLFGNMNPVGTTVKIDGHPFRVIGTLARKGKILDESLDLVAIVPHRTFRALLGKKRPGRIAVSVDTPEHVKAAVDELTGILRRARKTPPGAPDDFSINRPEQLAATYQQLTGALYGVAIGVGLITLLVGGIGIMNIMLVSVRERTREIGIRRALGARRRTIILQFLLEAAAVSAVGGLGGTLVGLSAAWIVGMVTPLAAAVKGPTVLFGVLFAAVVGVVFGIWPAARAASLDPVEALRYE